jgi:glycosyltransferase involved in cell wall biosynthesis
MRIAFTIIFNGLHHLKHFNYLETLLPTFDYWVFVEGACNPTGSTRWCKPILDKYHKDGHSIDGTLEYLRNMANINKKVILVENNGFWNNKDDMVNAAMPFIKSKKPKFLWQIDCDEMWNNEQIVEAEEIMILSKSLTGTFLSEYYVKENLIAIGEWGEGHRCPYNRVWRYNGQSFASHEPPILEGGNGKVNLLPQMFKHYAYYYEHDVLFKQDFYGYTNLHKNWVALSKMITPIRLNYFLMDGGWSKSKTLIVDQDCPRVDRIRLMKKYFQQ